MSAVDQSKINPRRILSVSERKGLEREIEREKAYLHGRIDASAARDGDRLAQLPERRRLYIESQFSWDPGMDDKSAVMGRINRKARTLENGQPDSIGTAEKAAIEKRAREHEEFFKQNMNSKKNIALPYGHPDFTMAVKAGLREHSQEFQRRATDWKNIQRQLNPDDPNASNLERLRPS